MACDEHSECTGQQICSNGECVDVETPEPREVRRTFATTSGEYLGQLRSEMQQLDDFGSFIGSELEEAERLRKEEEEDVGFFGTLFSFIGAGIGCLIGSSAGPAGCVKGATIGAGIGSVGGRFGTDIANTAAEESGLSEEELARLDPSQMQLIQEQYWDLHDDAVQMQQTLEDFDDNQWKAHVLGAIGDTWNIYKMASMATKLGFMAGEELVEDIAEESIIDLELLEQPGTSGMVPFGGTEYGESLLETTGKLN